MHTVPLYLSYWFSNASGWRSLELSIQVGLSCSVSLCDKRPQKIDWDERGFIFTYGVSEHGPLTELFWPVGQKNVIRGISWSKADHLKTARNKKTEREEPRTERALQGLLFSALPTSLCEVPTTSQEPIPCKHISKGAPTVIADSGSKPVTQEPGRTDQNQKDCNVVEVTASLESLQGWNS